jgi:hypothetical protein
VRLIRLERLAITAALIASTFSSRTYAEDYTIWTPNLPYFWLQTLANSVVGEKRYPEISTTNCLQRYKEYRSAARLAKIWIPKPINANVSSNISGEFIDNTVKDSLTAYGVNLGKNKGIQIDIITVPSSSADPLRPTIYHIPESVDRPGIIELLYINPVSGNCYFPFADTEGKRDLARHQFNKYKILGIDMSMVYLSPRMLLPEIANTIVETGAIDPRAPPSESMAIVDLNGRITRVQCFITDFARRSKLLRTQIVRSCFDILTSASSKKPTLRRYFDDTN